MTSHINKHECPLCSNCEVVPFFADKNRAYLRCLFCELVFVPREYSLTSEDEKAIYDLHQNDAQDLGYRQFLSRLSTPLLEKLEKPGARQRGLDFGCGPGPTLSTFFEEQGHHVDLYDPFYYNDPGVFEKKYDFICATEVVEHLSDPDREFAALFSMLKQGGWLGIMTKLVIDRHAFSNWHYIRDMTHICFYSKSTFNYLADRFKAELSFVANDVILLGKKPY
jgi:SAM-dependent methyltransferase